MRLAQGEDPVRLTPREWQARFAGETAERRNNALALLLGKLDA